MGVKLFLAGTKPPPGRYRCAKCPYEVVIDESQTELEICPICGAEEYFRIED